MANSAAFRGTKEVDSISGAVIRLGFNRVRSIVIAASLSNVFPKTPSFDKNKFWRTTFITENIAKILAKHSKFN